ncbi:unnamed protein product [Paramecium primaurelia]|uniref:G domain-containing protein n=1 Tax=Paramecium primaurelia TaxID=5886 RepID=A0A8S1P6T2_PARPR|nr:unnamed protein product [Paramecium primaurelia]
MIELQEQREILQQQNNPEQKEQQQFDNIEQATISKIFKELEEIRQFQKKRSLEIKKNKDLCLFYFNLTEGQNCQIDLKEYIKPKIIDEWKDGFIGEVKDTQIIVYFQNLMQNNDKQSKGLNYCELSKIKLFMKSFLQQNNFKKLNFIVQFNNEENQEILQKKIKHRIFQLFEGFFEGYQKQKDIFVFCLLDKQQKDYDHQNECQENNSNTKEGYIYSLNEKEKPSQPKQIYSSQITIEYFNNISENKINVIQMDWYFKQIGFSCISQKLCFINSHNLFAYQTNKLKNLLELQINLNEEAKQYQKIQEYLNYLKQLIQKIKGYINVKNLNLIYFKQLCSYLQDITRFYLKILEENLNQIKDIPTISWKIEKYLSEQKNNILNFNVDFTDNDMNLLDYFKEYYTFDYLKEIIKLQEKSLIFWFEHFESPIPQRLSYINNLIGNQNDQNNQNRLNVLVLGNTRVGKSTLLNILHNPNNMKLIQLRSGRYCFDVIDNDNMFEISHGNNSKTFSIKELQINTGKSDLIFIDTPGFNDTQVEKRLINQIQMFQRINKSKQFVTLFLIDGDVLEQDKTKLLDSIEHFYLFFDNQLNMKQLEQILIPVFTKVNEAIMGEIKNKWESSTMQKCNSKQEKEFLRVIKNKIDNNQYITLFKAEKYFISSLEQLKKDKQAIIDKMMKEEHNEVSQKEMQDKYQKITLQIQNLEVNQQKIQYQIINSDINKIRDQIFSQCQVLYDQQRELNEEFNFQLKLTPSMENSLNIVLKHFSQINNYIDELISYIIINQILFKQNNSFEQIQNSLQKVEGSLNSFDKQEINSEKLWLDLCKHLNLTIDSQFLNEYLSQIQKLEQLNQLGKKIQIEQQKFVNFKQKIDLLQKIVKDTIEIDIKDDIKKNMSFFRWSKEPTQQELEFEKRKQDHKIQELIRKRYFDKIK